MLGPRAGRRLVDSSPGSCGMAIGDRFRGAFDDLRIFDRALRPAEAKTLCQAPELPLCLDDNRLAVNIRRSADQW